jgi:hypothetical protein
VKGSGWGERVNDGDEYSQDDEEELKGHQTSTEVCTEFEFENLAA